MSKHMDKYKIVIAKLKAEIDINSKITDNKISFANKEIQHIIRDQEDLDYIWQNLNSDAVELCNELEQITNEKLAKAFKNLMDSDRSYTPSETKLLAASDEVYNESMRIYNKARAAKQKISGILTTIDNRRWIIKDLASLIIDGSEDFVIDDE